MHGFATSDWVPLLNLLTDDFTFWFPIGAYHGLNVGKDRAKEFFLICYRSIWSNRQINFS
ncbi:hypothetical protein RIVM261_046940 [Rivularia sp. IAM M-261]|nr:hypothetical protein CAL7716_088210 [Calothrix sp. PCC 7716]GJD19738.1 hypothetical protein RIVM261_046940 [Rivularia sp. IAM M-261]